MTGSPRVALVTATLLATLLAAAPVTAFVSIEKGQSPHDEITGVAADLDWPQDAVEALRAAVRQADIDDLQEVEGEDGKKRMDASVTYQPWHHCTRKPPQSDADAFNATVRYIAQQRGLAENLSLLDPAAAVRALGRALHALQDCFSHSNIVDLDPVAQGQLAHALVHGGTAPAEMVLCSVLPHSSDIERPPGDPYSHADFNKDGKKTSPEAQLSLADGQSKYERAHALAAEATHAFLLDFMPRLEPAAAERLLAVELDTADKGKDIPAAGLLLAPALALAALLRRRGGKAP